jgi:hypothetical protein
MNNCGFQVIRESFSRNLSKYDWTEASFTQNSAHAAILTFSAPSTSAGNTSASDNIQVKLISMSSHEVAAYVKRNEGGVKTTESSSSSSSVIMTKINLPTNFSYTSTPVVYLPEIEIHRIDQQIHDEVIVRLFPPLTESPMLPFLSESSVINIASFLPVSLWYFPVVNFLNL